MYLSGLVAEGLLLAESRREKRLAKLVADYTKAQDKAKTSRVCFLKCSNILIKKNAQSWYFVVAAELVAIRRLHGRRRQGVRIPTLDVCAINSYSSAETSGLRKLKNFTHLPIVSNQNWRFIYRKSYPHACIQVRHL